MTCKENCLLLNMNIFLKKYKRIHPGIILERELKKERSNSIALESKYYYKNSNYFLIKSDNLF